MDPISPTTRPSLLPSPSSPSPASPVTPTASEERGTEFLRAVYLDSPSISLPHASGGGTKPLRVRKRSARPEVAPVAVHGTRIPRRRSTVSLPKSPRSPRSHRASPVPRSPVARPIARPSYSRSASHSTLDTVSTTLSHPRAGVHPHQSISQIFLALDPTSPPGMPYSQSHHAGSSLRPTMTRQSRSSSTQSELHLGLGRFHTYDESAKPLPSPPDSTSPVVSPTRALFVASQNRTPPNPGKGKALPPSPLTPSRAPRKAAELLGAAYATPAHRSKGRSKRRDHFRPLPSGTLVEIERFFGDVPRKPKAVPSGVKSSANAKQQQRAHTSRSEQGGASAKGGASSTGDVRHKGDDGTMWLDVEEEQEFAWLMSDFNCPDVWSAAGDGSLGAVEVLYEETDEDKEEAAWGMKPLTSVLSLQSTKSSKGKGKAKLPIVVDSVPPLKVVRPAARPDHTPDPWSTVPPRSIPTVQVPPPLMSRAASPASVNSSMSTASAAASVADSGSRSDGSDASDRPGKGGRGRVRDLSSSPPRERNRPPPLRLVERARNPHLPTISRTPLPESATLPLPPRLESLHPLPPMPTSTSKQRAARAEMGSLDNTKLSRPALARPVKSTSNSTSTSTSRSGASKHKQPYPNDGPKTPFVHPRQAPKPSSSTVPPLPTDTRVKTASKEKEKNRRPPVQRSDSGSDRSREGVSFFEPVTPTAAAGKKTRWLKKVVNLGSR